MESHCSAVTHNKDDPLSQRAPCVALGHKCTGGQKKASKQYRVLM